MKKLFFKVLLICVLVGISVTLFSQNTIGLLSYDVDKSTPGYTLIYPHSQPNVYLLNACGEIVHRWDDDTDFVPGNIAYLMPNGDLFKAKRSQSNNSASHISAGGAAGIVELRDWDNNLLWRTDILDSMERAHHDIAPLPNGNVLVLAWEVLSIQDQIANGRDTSIVGNTEMWPEFIREYNPKTDSIVWEWHTKDHLIQDFDSTKLNYGILKDHPELVDINVDIGTTAFRGDWMHSNALDYNPHLDQILLSVPNFNEIWIIDHSTNSNEAQGHTGGISKRGGDLIYRWGNPQIYDSGDDDDQKLFFQHDSHWIDNVDSTNPYFGSIAVFNNRVGPQCSKMNILKPDFDQVSKKYRQNNQQFLPKEFQLTLSHPDTVKMYSGGLSSIQLLPNDNVLICVGRSAYIFEMTNDQEIVWEYKLPLKDGIQMTQGDPTTVIDNALFRAKRYPLDYPAFINRDLTPKGYIELNPNVDFCKIVSSNEDEFIDNRYTIFPNPTTGEIKIAFPEFALQKIQLYTQLGQHLYSWSDFTDFTTLDINLYPAGMYILKINDTTTKKIFLLK